MIGDAANATTVPAPNVGDEHNRTPGFAERSRRVNLGPTDYSDFGSLVVTGGRKVAVRIGRTARHVSIEFDTWTSCSATEL